MSGEGTNIMTPRHRTDSLRGFGWGAWTFAVLYSAFVVVYTDYLAYQAAGRMISFVLAGIILATAVVNFRAGLYAALLVVFTMPTFPRDILDIYTELLVTRYIEFNSIKFLSVAGFSLIQWVFIGLFFVAFIRFLLRGGRIESVGASRAASLSFMLSAVLLIGAAVASVGGQAWNLREFMGDFRFPVLFTFGLFIGWAYADSLRSTDMAVGQFVRFLVLLVMVSGIKSIFFLVDDAMAETFRLGFANPNYVTFPFLIALVIVREETGISSCLYYALLGLGAFSIIPEGRGAIVIYLIVIALAGTLVIVHERAKAPRFVLSTAGIAVLFGLALIAVITSNERFRDYLSGKTLFFTEEIVTGELSPSPAVRVNEFRNIMHESAESNVGLLWGKGAGGYFRYERFPLPFELSISDYSANELRSGRYYHPHLPINYWFLKGGVLGLLLYSLVYYRMFRTGIRSLARDRQGTPPGGKLFHYFIVLSTPIGFIQSYWQPEYIFYFAIILMMLLVRRKGKTHGQAVSMRVLSHA